MPANRRTILDIAAVASSVAALATVVAYGLITSRLVRRPLLVEVVEPKQEKQSWAPRKPILVEDDEPELLQDAATVDDQPPPPRYNRQEQIWCVPLRIYSPVLSHDCSWS